MTEEIRQFGEKPLEEYRDRVSAYAIVFDEQGRLLTLKVKGVFHLPGGGVEVGEEMEEAVAREAMEEAGCEITDLVFLGRANQFCPKTEKGPINKIATFYRAKMVGMDLSKAVEKDHEVFWLTIEEFLTAEARDFQKWAIRETKQRLA